MEAHLAPDIKHNVSIGIYKLKQGVGVQPMHASYAHGKENYDGHTLAAAARSRLQPAQR
jgi:hypothetical protein